MTEGPLSRTIAKKFPTVKDEEPVDKVDVTQPILDRRLVMLPPNSTVETKTQEEPTPINPETEVPLPLCPPDDLKLAKRKALSERLGPRTKEWKHKRFRPVPTTKRVRNLARPSNIYVPHPWQSC